MDIIEKVARAICEADWGHDWIDPPPVAWMPLPPPPEAWETDMQLIERVQVAVSKSLGDDLENHMLRSRRIKVSRAAIAEVFNWLAEPGDNALSVGLMHMPDSAGYILPSAAKSVWTAMLAAKRKEAMGDDA